jgi:uncharacterized phage-associated protein
MDSVDSKTKKKPSDAVHSDEKFPKMMHYIISKYRSRGVPKTLLAKLCYFSDFDNYELYAESITGEKYRRVKHGPLAASFKDSCEKLVNTEKIRIEETETAGGNTMFKCISIDEPSIGSFSKRDLETIDWVIERYGNLTPRTISDLSHNDIPWVSTKPGEIIDYELVFYRNDMTSVSDEDIEDDESGPD